MQELIVPFLWPTIERMVTDDIRRAFSERLNKVLDDANFPAKGSGRQKLLGSDWGVSQKGARKWLEGEAIPETTRLIEMAARYNVSFEWLATGVERGPMPGPAGWDKLRPDERAAIQWLIDATLAGVVTLPNTKPRNQDRQILAD